MADREPSRGGALAALALATLLGMSTWFSGTAVSGPRPSNHDTRLSTTSCAIALRV